jgi:hypothetical protein
MTIKDDRIEETEPGTPAIIRTEVPGSSTPTKKYIISY